MSNEENQNLREREEDIIEIRFFNDNDKNQILNGKEISIVLFEQSQLLFLYLFHFPLLLCTILLMIYNLPKNYYKTRMFLLCYSLLINIVALFIKCIIYFKYEKKKKKIIIRIKNLISELYPKIVIRTKIFTLEINEATTFIIEKEDISKSMMSFSLYYIKNSIETCLFDVVTLNQLHNEYLKLKQYFEIINSLNKKKIKNNTIKIKS